ncbi:MGH1-like glycoside hydrolase domain-containing protein [Zavarzinella formosa]|uniref:MGH1-like glycoside hydrolase domain-containing protein n=1 Tax=Zavarzinella formosa TaxID=360055 RepID=UPI00030416B2|nr:hypothetical protein [Zavarzinella formosa]
MPFDTPEHRRLADDQSGREHWRRWGPYLSERSWGTVREDYSPNGEAWDFLTHDMARSKAYRWGEDGLAGVSDRYQIINLAFAFWNGQDPILKERLFGLSGREGNHGEDVKEYYFYLDATPTFSYAKYLYKYPHKAYPYQQLLDGNRGRGKLIPEWELLDTGVLHEDRYHDIVIEFARLTPEDMCVRVEVFNRGAEDAPIHVLPHLWFRNTWAWDGEPHAEPRIDVGSGEYPCLRADDRMAEPPANLLGAYHVGERFFYGEAGGVSLFTDNETDALKLYGPTAGRIRPYVKNAFHRQIINKENCTNPAGFGTKACLHYAGVNVPAGGSRVFRFRFSHGAVAHPFADFDQNIATRRREADEFYSTVHPQAASDDEKNVQRQALAGMIWSKQIYLFDVSLWFGGDNPAAPPPPARREIRNTHWLHLNSMRILSMPDKWEYPWFAAWDLAFHCVPLALVDPEFAKDQLWLLLFEQFQHPNGQIPAYEWEFGDLNPPVHAWAVWRVYNMDRLRSGKADRVFLEKCFHKLLINFAWWVNKVDVEGNNVFEGGFLGLDNITLIDRSRKHTNGARLEQSDATGWMGMFSLNLMRIALELAKENRAYESMATKFLEHFVTIGAAMHHAGGRDYELWSERDGFFYDVLVHPDGSYQKFRVRSMVGLIPLFAVERLEADWIAPFHEFRGNLEWYLKNRADLIKNCLTTLEVNGKTVHVLSLATPSRLKRMLKYVWDPEEFRSEHGIRSLSKFHKDHPFAACDSTVGYEPAESRNYLKGGNSNWRGPVWFPTSFLMIESLRKLKKAFGDEFAIACPDHPEGQVTLEDMASGIANRMISIFTRDGNGQRAVYEGNPKFQNDPHWRDLILFFEYFHGDTGAGLGASHQTGWTGLVASLIDEWR